MTRHEPADTFWACMTVIVPPFILVAAVQFYAWLLGKR